MVTRDVYPISQSQAGIEELQLTGDRGKWATFTFRDVFDVVERGSFVPDSGIIQLNTDGYGLTISRPKSLDEISGTDTLVKFKTFNHWWDLNILYTIRVESEFQQQYTINRPNDISELSVDLPYFEDSYGNKIINYGVISRFGNQPDGILTPPRALTDLFVIREVYSRNLFSSDQFAWTNPCEYLPKDENKQILIIKEITRFSGIFRHELKSTTTKDITQEVQDAGENWFYIIFLIPHENDVTPEIFDAVGSALKTWCNKYGEHHNIHAMFGRLLHAYVDLDSENIFFVD